MTTEHSEDNKKSNKDAAVQPDSETLHTTDPQEHMEGPLSSLMQKTEKSFEGESDEKDEKEEDK